MMDSTLNFRYDFSTILRICSFILIVILVSSCKNVNNTEVKIQNKLDEWNFVSDVSISNNNKTLYIDLFFNESYDYGVKSNLLDLESNNLLVAMLNYTFYKDMIKYDVVSYNLRFENQKDMKDYTVDFNRSALDENIERFDKASLFYNFVEYAYKEIRRADFVRSNAWINYFSQYPQFDFFGSFWNLLYNYSLECTTSQSSTRFTYLFIAFVGSIQDPDNIKEDDIEQEKLLYYIESCGNDPNLINLNLYELMDAINYKPPKL